MSESLRLESAASDSRVGKLWVFLAALAAMALFTTIELLEDGLSLRAFSGGLLESVALVAPAAVVVLLYRQVQRQRAEQSRISRELERMREVGSRWRIEKREILRGLGAAIDEQFEQWGLTPAESDVALLMLKGLDHSEIAALRGTSVRTVRQQARSVYAKGGLSGRLSLSAFFLEDLLLPRDQTDPA